MSRGATARLFVAVDPPLEVREALAAWARAATAGLAQPARAAGGLRLLDPQLLHLTLCFLGARPVAELAALSSMLEDCAAHACELSLGAPLWLPARSPRALAVAVHDHDGELVRLHDQLVGALTEVSAWEPERRRYRAHITVARVRGGGRRRGGRGLRGGRGEERPGAPLAPTPRLSFVPETLSLYRSWLGPEGASYEPLAGCTLVPAGG